MIYQLKPIIKLLDFLVMDLIVVTMYLINMHPFRCVFERDDKYPLDT